MQARTGIHWLNFSLPVAPDQKTLDGICRDLFGYPLARFNHKYGYRNGYAERWILNPDNKLVTFYTKNEIDHRDNCYFEISGLGMDTLNIDLIKTAQYVSSHGGNLTKIDLYADCVTGTLPFEEMVRLSHRDNYRERLRCNIHSSPDYNSKDTDCIRYGSPKSKRSCIIYNKGILEGTNFPWIRVELSLSHNDDCRQFVSALVAGASLPELIADHIGSYIQFLRLNSPKKSAREPMPWWVEFLGETRKIVLQRKKYLSTAKVISIEEKKIEMLAKKAAARGDWEALENIAKIVQAELSRQHAVGE
jgi:DNA relaxase NicK